jgi:hypothetical protein
MIDSRLPLVLVCLAAVFVLVAGPGCSLVVDDALRDRVDAAVPEDAGPPPTACTGRPNGTFCEIEGLVDRSVPTIEVQNRQELKDSIGAELNQLLGVVYALLALAVIPVDTML